MCKTTDRVQRFMLKVLLTILEPQTSLHTAKYTQEELYAMEETFRTLRDTV